MCECRVRFEAGFGESQQIFGLNLEKVDCERVQIENCERS